MIIILDEGQLMHSLNRQLIKLLLILFLLLPINIYIIGDGIGAGLQFAFLRYQQTYLGASFITLINDFSYVTSGIIGGRSALSILLWILGTALLLAAAGYLIYSRYNDVAGIKRPLALLTAGGAAAYLFSCIAQYGPTLYGPAGFSIPIGVPLIFAVAVSILKAEDDESEYEEDDWEETEEEE